MPVIELFQLRAPELAAETVLMFSNGVGHHVSQMPRHILPAFRWRLAYSVKSTDLNIRRAGQPGRVKVWRQNQPVLGHHEPAVEVAEDLPEVIHASQYLVGPACRDRRIPYQCIVRYVDGRNFVVIL